MRHPGRVLAGAAAVAASALLATINAGADPKPLGPAVPSSVPLAVARQRLADQSRGLPPEAQAQLDAWRGPDGKIHTPPLPVSDANGNIEKNPDGSVKLYDATDQADPRNSPMNGKGK